MIGRDSGYFGKNATKRRTKRDLDGALRVFRLREAKRASILWRLLYCLCYVAFCLFTLHFILEKILVGGFYSTAHGAAIAFLISAAVLLVLGIVLFFAVWRIRYKTGFHFIRIMLFATALVIAVISMGILGVSGYLVIAIAISVAVIAFQIVISVRTGESFSKPLHIMLVAVVAAALTVSCLFSFGAVNVSPSGEYVDMTAYSRVARYERYGEGGAKLSKVMLTAADAFHIKSQEVYEVRSSVVIDSVEYSITVIGEHAFRHLGSFDTVSLPDTVRVVEDGAFSESAVRTVVASGMDIDFGNAFLGSSVEMITLTSPVAGKVGVSSLPEGAVISVPRGLLDSYRAINPHLGRSFVPTVSEGELYVTFDIAADKDEADTTGGILETFIVKKDESGCATVELPLSEYVTENERYGTHWARRDADGTFRMLALYLGDRALTADTTELTLTDNAVILGQWQKMHYVYADASALGGGTVMIEELDITKTNYTLPTEYYFGGISGYVCRSFHENEQLVGGRVEAISDFSKDYVLYPRFELLAPTLTVDSYEAAYDACEHTLRVSLTHAQSVTVSHVTWKKDGTDAVLSGTTELTVKDVYDSGAYSVTVTVKDKDGRFATATAHTLVAITKAPLSVTAEAKGSVYQQSKAPLTYTHSGLLGGDTLSGALFCDISTGAGTHKIELGSLTAGENYHITYTPASYTVEKADASIDISGVLTMYVYTGALQSVNSGATLNHSETTLVYSNNTFTTVAEGNGMEVVITAPETDNYKSASATVTITVSPMTVAAPEYTATELAYTAEEIVFLAEDEVYPYTVSGGSATEVGSYTAILTLKDSENFVWESGGSVLEIEWSIV